MEIEVRGLKHLSQIPGSNLHTFMVEENKKEEKSASPEAKEEKKVEEPKEKKIEEKKEEPKKEEKEVKVPEKFKDLVEKVEKMSVMDLVELVKILEKKFGVTAASQAVAVAVPNGAAGAESQVEEKTEFNIELKEIGSQKIQVIKVVRDIIGKGLKESKDLVDAAANSPQVVKENVKKEEAEELKKKFEEAGAKVELK